MNRFTSLLTATAAVVLSMTASAVPAQARVETGLLTCEVGGGFALILSSPRELHCVFHNRNGQSEAYAGKLEEVGLDIGISGHGVISWAVSADTTELPPGELAGSYSGAEAGGSVVVGGSGRLLVGGSSRTISLQPLSVETRAGLNIAIGVASMRLYPLFRVSQQQAYAPTPAVGLPHDVVPHVYKTPHYSCGSYTHLQEGQTLSGVAHACGVSLVALLDANPEIANVRDISAGKLIHIPTHVGHARHSPCGDRGILDEGEGLDHLAWRCGVTLHALLMENPGVRDTALIRPGLVLHIPERGEAATRPPVQYARAEADLPVRVAPEPAHTRAPVNTATNQSDEVQVRRVHFAQGSNSATVEDSITGYEIIDYVLRARRGQSINVSMATQNSSSYFNVLPPNGNGYALFNGSVSGDTFEGVLSETGDYTVRVYLMRAAARRGERADYRLEMTIDTPAAGTGTAGNDTSAAQRAGGGDYDATGSMPCAQVAGQPLGNCPFGVSREGSGSATVVVTRPDGSTRALFFIHGRFNCADTSQTDGYPDYSSTRSSDVTIVRVGEETYHVDDAVLFGG